MATLIAKTRIKLGSKVGAGASIGLATFAPGRTIAPGEIFEAEAELAEQTAANTAPRSLATIDAAIAEIDADLERRNGEEGARRSDQLERVEAHFAGRLVSRDKGDRVPADDIAAARQAVEDAKLDIEANEHTIRSLTKQREELQRERDGARGDEALAQEQRVELGLAEARTQLLHAVFAAIQARGTEYAWESARHQARVQLDKLADETKISGLRRGVFVFDGAYRPHLDRLTDELTRLCNELGVNIDERGRLVPRAQPVPASVAAVQTHDDQVDDLDVEGDLDDEGDGDLD